MWSVRNWVKSIAAEYVADYVNNESWGFARDASSAAHRAEASKVRCNAALEQAREASAEAKQAASDAKAWAEKALEASGKAEYCKIMARLAQEKCEEAKPSPISQLIGRINEVDAALEAMRVYVDERIEQEGLVLRGWVNEQLDDVEDGARGLGEYDGAFGIENITYANLREWQASLTNTARKEALDDALRLPEACEFIAAYRRLYADGHEAQSAKRPVVVLREKVRSYEEGMARFAAYVLRCARHHRQAQKS